MLGKVRDDNSDLFVVRADKLPRQTTFGHSLTRWRSIAASYTLVFVSRYRGSIFVRLRHALGRFFAWAAGIVKQVGGSLNGGRSGDEYAAKLYEQPRDEYRP